VKNGGGTETSLLTFGIIDSVGNSLALAGIPIVFTHQGVSGSFSADTVLTNSSGRVQVLFQSDTAAGVVQIVAQTSNGSIQSSPVTLVIVGGRPSQSYFTFFITKPGAQTKKVNFPGALPLVQQVGTATVQLGDRYGNIVPSGTTVYFSTNAGIIQGSALTNANGYATVNWFGGNPVPAGGVAIVSASSIGDNGQITVNDTVTYSGQALITGGPPNNFTLNGGTVQTYTYYIKDANGNPLAEGNDIQVNTSGDAEGTTLLTGILSLPRSIREIHPQRDFHLLYMIQVRRHGSSDRLQFTISVSGPNGTATQVSSGRVLPVGSGDTTRSRLPGSIAFLSISPANIQVIGTGGVETSTLIFEVRDSLGIPVNSRYPVQFSFANSPGGGEFITPETGYSDPSTGQISVIVHSGTKSGVVQLRATVTTPTGNVTSDIVSIEYLFRFAGSIAFHNCLYHN